MRIRCLKCFQPEFSCYCGQIEKFDPKIQFIILIHPIEARRRIASGRMAHLILEGSKLIRGYDYSNNETVNEIIADKNNECFILYPGADSKNLTFQSPTDRLKLFNPNKKLVIFVIDGTWSTAKKSVRRSKNLFCLPRICFSPPHESNFRVRKQPRPNFLSTLEAIHHTIELIGSTKGFNTETHEHDKLLKVFDHLIDGQVHRLNEARSNPKNSNYRRGREI